ESRRISDHRNSRVVVVVSIEPGNAACLEQLEPIAQNLDRWIERGIRVVGLIWGPVENATPDRVKEWGRNRGFTFPLIHDYGNELGLAYGFGGGCELVLINPRGQVAYTGSIPADLTTRLDGLVAAIPAAQDEMNTTQRFDELADDSGRVLPQEVEETAVRDREIVEGGADLDEDDEVDADQPTDELNDDSGETESGMIDVDGDGVVELDEQETAEEEGTAAEDDGAEENENDAEDEEATDADDDGEDDEDDEEGDSE
ncbi:MAG TPA: redoxin domain-containing protein, partial [bacterium]|nr:redoxin domain-containing protein [bacterium]